MNEAEDKLVILIASIFRKLKQDGFAEMDSEEAVKHGAILPVLQELGWSVFDPKECRPEYGPSWKVDYALFLKGKPRVFIEAKAVSSQLTPDNQQQLCTYTSQHGVPLAILTNGKSWEFYLALTEGLFHERKIYSIEVEHQDVNDAAGHMVSLLSKPQVESGQAEAYAKKLHESHMRDASIDAALPKAWEKLFKDPDSILLDYLAEEAEAICGFKPDAARVRAFLESNQKPVKLTDERKDRRRKEKKAKESTPDSRVRDKGPINPEETTGTKPTQAQFLGLDLRNPKSWFSVLYMLCVTLAKLHPSEYRDVFLSIEGRRNPYFSEKPSDLRKARLIRGTKLYVETNFSSQSIIRIAYKLLEGLGHKKSEFKVRFIPAKPIRSR